MANYIQIFFDFPEMTAELSFEERGRLVDAMVRYGRGDEVDVEQLTGNERFLWPVFRGQLERNGALSLVRAEAGRKGGKCTKIESSDSNDAQDEASASKGNQIEATSSKSPIVQNPKTIKREGFAPPTLEEVCAYMANYTNQKSLNVDPGHEAGQFLDYYEGVGWRVGQANRPMRDWQAAARRWLTNGFTSAPPARAAPARADLAVDPNVLY